MLIRGPLLSSPAVAWSVLGLIAFRTRNADGGAVFRLGRVPRLVWVGLADPADAVTDRAIRISHDGTTQSATTAFPAGSRRCRPISSIFGKSLQRQRGTYLPGWLRLPGLPPIAAGLPVNLIYAGYKFMHSKEAEKDALLRDPGGSNGIDAKPDPNDEHQQRARRLLESRIAAHSQRRKLSSYRRRP
jgi:hypothetical protein